MTLPLLSRTVAIPPSLHEIHGTEATVGELALVWLGGLALAALALAPSLTALQGWRGALLVAVTVDLSGGVLANLCPGTQAYWGAKSGPMRALFLGIHVIHPVLLGVALQGPWPALLCLWGWLLVAAGGLSLVRGPLRPTLALALALGGVLAWKALFAPGDLVENLGVLYLLKLLFGFAGHVEGRGAQGPEAV